MFLMVSFFIIPYSLIGCLSIHGQITCIVHDLCTLGVAQKIQVVGSL